MDVLQPPSSPSPASVTYGEPVNVGTLFITALLTFLAALIYAGIYFAAPAFNDLFKGFGADLPLLTRLMFATYPYFGLLTLIGLVPTVWLFLNRHKGVNHRDRLVALACANPAIAFLVMTLCVAAFYLPIFKMGSVIET